MDLGKAKRSISELQEQALIAGTRCSTLKSQLNYMKMLYYDSHSRAEEVKPEDFLAASGELSCGNVPSIVSNNEIAIKIPPEETNSRNFLKDVQSICDMYKEESDIKSVEQNVCRTPRSDKTSSKSNIAQAEIQQVKTSNVAKAPGIPTPRTYPISRTPSIFSKCELPERKHNLSNNSYQNQLAECSVGEHEAVQVFDARNLTTGYLLEELASLKEDPKKQEVMHISKNVKSNEIAKRRNITKEKKERVTSSVVSSKKNSSSKLDEILSVRIKRKRGRVRSSNSRSTVSTNFTNLTRKRDSKKRKQKGYSVNQQPKDISKEQRNCNEVVEIYHNSAANEGSGCAISSKRSMLETQPNQMQNPTTTKNRKNESVGLKDKSANSHQVSLQCEKTEETRPGVCEVATSPVFPSEKCNRHDSRDTAQMPYDPMAPRSYEMPTLASKLKRANRCYFSRFNFQNIPFVVGTSVTPSHNLGLNIQQVLSIMKMRQPTANGIAPLLIRKVSRGLEPMSVLIDQINDQWNTPLDVRSQVIRVSDRKENLFPCYSSTESARRENKDVRNTSLKHRSTGYTIAGSENVKETRILMPFTQQENTKNRSAMSTASGVENGMENGGLCCVNSVPCPQSSRGIREVLVNLHDQFEGMNARYEELQAKVEHSADERLQKEMFDLEKELNAKEEEINAVVGLYKEVMALKHQMKKLQEKNSLVYISTEIPMHPDKYASIPLMLNKSHVMNARRANRRSYGFSATREPSVSVRLTGLLRQIQTIQKQLKFAS